MGSFLDTSQAFSAFYRSHAAALLVFFTRRTFDPQGALDLVAETFAEAYACRGRFRGSSDSDAGGWLYAIARRQLARYFERGQAELKLSLKLSGGRVFATDEDLERIEELACLADSRLVLREQLLELGHEQREALWLRVVDEEPYAVIASRLNITEQTARARVSRGLRSLSEVLGNVRDRGDGCFD